MARLPASRTVSHFCSVHALYHLATAVHDSRSLPLAGMEEINDRRGPGEKIICDVGGRGQDNKLALMMVRYIAPTYENGMAEGGNKEYNEFHWLSRTSALVDPRRSNAGGVHVWRLYRSSAAPKQTSPIVRDSQLMCFCSEAFVLVHGAYKRLFICERGERRAADCSLFVMKKKICF